MKHRVEFYWSDLTPAQQALVWWQVRGKSFFWRYQMVAYPILVGILATIFMPHPADDFAFFGGFFCAVAVEEVRRYIIS